MAHMISIQAQLPWMAAEVEDGGWVAACPPLRLTAEGDTREELESMIHEILDDWFRARLAAGDLNVVLARYGWSFSGTLPTDPGDAEFKVPVEIQNVAQDDFARLAN